MEEYNVRGLLSISIYNSSCAWYSMIQQYKLLEYWSLAYSKPSWDEDLRLLGLYFLTRNLLHTPQSTELDIFSCMEQMRKRHAWPVASVQLPQSDRSAFASQYIQSPRMIGPSSGQMSSA